MPNIITHTLFADDFLQDAAPLLSDWLMPRKQLVEIGSNGPDFLFFHGLRPWHMDPKSQLRPLGNRVHSSHISAFYEKALECIRKEKDETIKKDMSAYVIGHLMHWSLDSIAHPYVYYRTGHGKSKNSWWHHRFESLIDAIMLKVKREQTIQDFQAYQITQASLEQIRAIARIYVPIAREFYDVEIKPHQIKECIDDWTFVQKCLYDASGKKATTLRKLEMPLAMENALSGLFVPNAPEDPFDTMNLLHKEWCHPCDDTITSTESFFDLYDRAMDLAFQVIGAFLDCLQDPQKDPYFLDQIQEKDYNTGLNEDLLMRYFKPVYEE